MATSTTKRKTKTQTPTKKSTAAKHDSSKRQEAANVAAAESKAAEAIVNRAKRARKRITVDSLRQWNRWLAGLHFAQGIIILILSTTRTLPITTNYLAVDQLATKAHGNTPVLAAGTSQIGSVNLAYLVALFFFMSAAAHLVVATVYRKRYEADLGRGVNKVRWIEYALSASTMMVAIGLLVGVYDLSSMIMLFGLTAVMNLLGLVMEVHNLGAKKPNWLSYIVGTIAGVIPWAVIGIYLVSGAVYGSKAPAFVYWIFVSILAFFASFAVNMYLQYRRTGKWANYLYGERMYMILSLVAKTALAWQVFAGTLRP